jgi:Astacin (Peptidase family M12A)
MRFNFDQHITDGDDVGPYDYCSIMHYGAWAFSIDENTRDKPTIDVLRSDLQCGDANSIGQRNGLSAGDIAAVIQMYANVIPGVGRNADGRLEVFLVGSDKQLHHRWQTEKNSSTWSDGSPSLLGEWPDDSTVASNADGRLEVYIVGSDEHLYHRWQTAANSSIWSIWTEGNYTTNWNTLRGQFSLKSRPAVAQNADGRLAVFMVFLDRRLYVTTQKVANDSTSNAWDGWNVLGMQYLWPDDPVVAQNADGRLEVFLVGSDRRLYHRWQTEKNSSTWSDGWASLGGQWSHRRRPAVAQNADGRLEVFLVGLDKQLHHRSQISPNSSQWSEIWTVLGGQEWPPSSDPGIGRNADGRLEVFLVGLDKQLYHRRQTAPNSSTWSETWTSLGGGPFL